MKLTEVAHEKNRMEGRQALSFHVMSVGKK